jgi:hypothetical protein
MLKFPKKTTKTPRRKLIQKLDRVFSRWIRLRDSIDGVCTCCTCGKRGEIKKFHAGHFMGRQFYPTRWDEQNVHAQCPYCNTFNEGEKYLYSKFLANKYGENTPDLLVYKAKKGGKNPTFMLEILIDKYEKLLKTQN